MSNADQQTPKKRNSVAGASVPTCFAQPLFVPVKECQWSVGLQQSAPGARRHCIGSAGHLFEELIRRDLTCCLFRRIPDDQRANCLACKRGFNAFTRRKHHCRGCAEIFCMECSAWKLVTKPASSHEIVAVRVCSHCFERWSVFEGQGLNTVTPVEPLKSRSRSSTNASTTPTPGGDPTSYPTQVSPSPTSLAKIIEQETAGNPTATPEGTTAAPFVLPFLPPSVASSPYLLPAVAGFIAVLVLLGFPGFLALVFSWSGALIGAAMLVVVAFLLQAREKQRLTATGGTRSTLTINPPVSPARARALTSDAALSPGVKGTLPDALNFSPVRSQSVGIATPPPPPLVLSEQDAAIIARTKIGVQHLLGHVEHPSEWRTKAITKPDGTGSRSITKEEETRQIGIHAPWSTSCTDDTIVVQHRMIPCPFTPGTMRPTWKATALVKADPRSMLSLYLDVATQTEWNKALVEVRVLREIKGTKTTLTYSVSAPAVGGAVSSRDFIDSHEWGEIPRTDPATGAVLLDAYYSGIGIEPPLWDEPISSKGYTRGRNGPAGFFFQSVLPPPGEAKSPDERWTIFVVLIDTEVRGWIPKSLVESSMPQVMIDYIINVRKLWAMRREKGIPAPVTPCTPRVGNRVI